MWYLMQHVSTLVGHIQAKIHGKTHKMVHTAAIRGIWRSQLTFVLHVAICLVIIYLFIYFCQNTCK